MKTCCVPGCTDKTVPRHNIPRDPRIRDIWIQRVGNPKLCRMLAENPKPIHTYTVCEQHFEDRCKQESGRLLKFSLPTLRLPGAPNFQDCFSYPPGPVRYVTPEKVREILKRKIPAIPMHEQSLFESDDVLAVEKPRVDYSHKKRILHRLDDAVPSTSSAAPNDFPLVEGVSFLPSSPPESITRGSCKKTLPPGDTRRKVRGLLRQGGVGRQCQLTPKAKFFYNKAKHLLQVGARHKAAQSSVRRRLKFLRSEVNMLNCLKDMNPTTLNFFNRNCETRSMNPEERFTLDDKILALSISKQSGKAYHYLSKMFALPSRKVLAGVLNNIPFNCGINEAIFRHLKHRVDKLPALDKYCVLMFDEVSLESGLQYNQRHDFVEGFVDFGGTSRQVLFADHALVFIIKGLHEKWKMPIYFTFCEATTPTADLVRILKDVVRQVRQTGLRIVCTISDQGATNRSAINTLLQETDRRLKEQNIDNRLQGYLIDDEEIVHLYDFPHLMKGIRNGLLDKDLHFIQNGIEKVASWTHVVKLYEMDKNRGAYSIFVKLSDEHVLPSKIKKMRVKNCTQVFSHTVGTAMHVAAELANELSPNSKSYLDPKASDTADLLLFFDKLFDSVNGSLVCPPPGKELRSVVTRDSKHVSFWQSSLPILNSMFFTKPHSSNPQVIPSMKNWIFSLRGLIYLTPKLFDAGFKNFAPRSLNQDPVENFFSCIRSHGVRNTNPTCSSFISSNKVLLVNNFVSPHSVGSNCEADESAGVLDNLTAFIEKQKNVQFVPPLVLPSVFPDVIQVKPSHLLTYTSAYVAGFVAKKIKKINNCALCNSRMCAVKGELPQNLLTHEGQYEGCRLTYPSSNFSCAFQKCTESLLAVIPSQILTYGIKARLIATIESTCLDNISILFCLDHQSNMKIFIKIVVNVVFHLYIKNVNSILKGSDVRVAKQDPLTSLAFDKHLKSRKKR